MTERNPIQAGTLIAVGAALPPDHSVMLRGRHGIGKSEIVVQIGEKLNMQVIDRRLSQMSEGDIIGLPELKDGVTRFCPPDWYMTAVRTAVILFLDELNRAGLENQQAAMQIVLSHELNGVKLHPDTRVYAAVNDSKDYQVNEMDPALLDRFSVYDFEPTLDDWTAWARGAGNIDPLVVEFIVKNKEHLENVGAIAPGHIYPSRRSWAAVDRALKHAHKVPSVIAGQPGLQSDIVMYHIMSGKVGLEATVSFMKFLEAYKFQISAEDILNNFPRIQKRLTGITVDTQSSLVSKLGAYCKENDITVEQAKNMADFGFSVPMEIQFNLWTVIADAGKDRLDNVKKFHKVFGNQVVKAVTAVRELQSKNNPG